MNAADRTARIADYRTRILAEYDGASPADMAAGMAWYMRAESTMDGIARTFSVSRETAAGIVAALSPRARWSTNLEWAATVLRARESGIAPNVSTRANRDKAWRIANGADPETVLGGPKVTAFYANLTGDPERVTVDVWAARAAGADPERLTPTSRADLRQAYTEAAAERGVTPRQLQAAVWVAVRGTAE